MDASIPAIVAISLTLLLASLVAALIFSRQFRDAVLGSPGEAKVLNLITVKGVAIVLLCGLLIGGLLYTLEKLPTAPLGPAEIKPAGSTLSVVPDDDNITVAKGANVPFLVSGGIVGKPTVHAVDSAKVGEISAGTVEGNSLKFEYAVPPDAAAGDKVTITFRLGNSKHKVDVVVADRRRVGRAEGNVDGDGKSILVSQLTSDDRTRLLLLPASASNEDAKRAIERCQRTATPTALPVNGELTVDTMKALKERKCNPKG